MDVGTSGWTEFKMSEDVTAYMAENMELFNCDIALVHSHHHLGAFFSGQDLKTLQKEGNDTNCFVSLIVDTKGEYKAAITRKVKKKVQATTVDFGTSYEFFGEGTISTPENPMSETTRVLENENIEYFMLDVEREEVENPYSVIDKRLEEITEQKKSTAYRPLWSFSDDYSASPYYKEPITKLPVSNNKPTAKEGLLFDEEEVYTIDPKESHYLTCQMITCSLIINKDVDLKQWITRHMDKKYGEIFYDKKNFEYWAESYVDFLIDSYSRKGESYPGDVYDYQSVLASKIYNELNTYPTNEYIKYYQELLTQYMYNE